MSTELVKSPFDGEVQLPVGQVGDDSDFAQPTSGQGLKQLRFVSKGLSAKKGFIPPGHYTMTEPGAAKDEAIDLGKAVQVVPLARRMKAIDYSDRENVLVSFDAKSDLYQTIKDKSDDIDNDCLEGVSFLVVEESTGDVMEFYVIGGPTVRAVVNQIYPYLQLTQDQIDRRGLKDVKPHGPLPLTLASRKRVNSKGEWHVPKVEHSSASFTNAPSLDVVTNAVQSFVNEKGRSGPKVVENAEMQGRAR